jgi:hypothetical protein
LVSSLVKPRDRELLLLEGLSISYGFLLILKVETNSIEMGVFYFLYYQYKTPIGRGSDPTQWSDHE